MPFADPRVEPALGLVVGAAARALLGSRGELGEGADDAGRIDVGEAERPDPRRVDDPAGVVRELQHDGGRRRVPPAPCHGVHHTGRPVRAGYEHVDQRRLAHPRVADEDGAVPVQLLPELGEVAVP